MPPSKPLSKQQTEIDAIVDRLQAAPPPDDTDPELQQVVQQLDQMSGGAMGPEQIAQLQRDLSRSAAATGKSVADIAQLISSGLAGQAPPPGVNLGTSGGQQPDRTGPQPEHQPGDIVFSRSVSSQTAPSNSPPRNAQA